MPPTPSRKPLSVVRELPPTEESLVVRALDEVDDRHAERHVELVDVLRGQRDEYAIQRSADRRAALIIAGPSIAGVFVIAILAILALADTRGVDVPELVDGASRLSPKVGTDLLELGESPADVPATAPAAPSPDLPDALPPEEEVDLGAPTGGRLPSLTPAAAAAEPPHRTGG